MWEVEFTDQFAMSGHKNYRILREKLEERLAADPEARLRVVDNQVESVE